MTIAKRKLSSVSFTQIRFTDTFWSPRIETNRIETLPYIYKKLQDTGRIGAFDLNFTRPVPSPIVLIFGDSDPAKWLEAACYSLAIHPDPNLKTLVDHTADKIIGAQQPDGYINTHFTTIQPEMRWRNLRDWHEMYCAGHLIEAAVAHYQATGNRKLLNALSRYADHIDATFGREPGKKRGYCGHPEIELALIRLYHATGNERYLTLASYFINERGQQSPEQPHYYDLEARARGEDPQKYWAKTYEYCQAQVPVREQEKVVGHAVRAMYLYCAVADLAAEFEDITLLETCQRVWDNLMHRRMYITGGIGPSKHNEGFTEDYDLPDETAYAETCATIGLILWNHRLLQFEGDRRFADVMERGLYNGFLSGVSMKGRHFFYDNPLSSVGDKHRVEWFECPCCPPNLARMIASIGNYFYSTGANDLWVHLFANSNADIKLGGKQINIRQTTRYPWDGDVLFELGVEQPETFTLHIRIPGWCEDFQIEVNGKAMDMQPDINGYLSLTNEWKNRDQIFYSMPLPIKAIWANPAVRNLEGCVAIQRGPLIYCLEGIDHNNLPLNRIAVNPFQIERDFIAEYRPNLLNGVTVIRGKGTAIDDAGWGETLYRSRSPKVNEIELTALPYCLWDNREPGEMRVWLRASAR
ncbi:MAG: beta-L-arabinofuranosidase domain-containing protein [Anaerolineales bacterium]|jgi:DUF1680 family protein